ncbi:hypothetical protein J7K41_02745 [Candidatus Micrarchaeota archaeon]|nr:hypothetical protein [Candidatus Micrarchaeota archaeon]
MPTRKKNTSSNKRTAAKVSRSKAGKKKQSKSVSRSRRSSSASKSKPSKSKAKRTSKKVVKKKGDTKQKKSQKSDAARHAAYERRKIIRARKNLLKDSLLRRTLVNKAGEHALAVVQALVKPMTHEELARKIKANKSEVRMTLYKLHQAGLVTYVRDKDEESGWYSYFWSFRDAKLKELAESLSKERTVAENGAVLFVCNVCDNEKVYTFEEAVDLKFRCPVCNSMLTNLSEPE